MFTINIIELEYRNYFLYKMELFFNNKLVYVKTCREKKTVIQMIESYWKLV